MKHYFAIMRVPTEVMDAWMTTTSAEEKAAQGKQIEADMYAWMDKYKDSFVEKGWPLGKTKRVKGSGVESLRNDLNYATIIKAENHDEAVKIFADCPHVKMTPEAYIDVMEIPHMGL